MPSAACRLQIYCSVSVGRGDIVHVKRANGGVFSIERYTTPIESGANENYYCISLSMGRYSDKRWKYVRKSWDFVHDSMYEAYYLWIMAYVYGFF